MNEQDHKSHGQKVLIIWIAIFMVIIFLAWLMTWQTKFDFTNRANEEGSFDETVNSLSTSWQQLREDFADQDINLGNISETLQQGLANLNEQNKDITAGVLSEISKLKVREWPKYESAALTFQYPETWLLIEEENSIIVKDEDLQVLVFKIYNDQTTLPDNINNLVLAEWLTEQANRELSIFAMSEEIDMGLPYPVYQVNTRNNEDLSNLWWQGQKIIWLNYNTDEEYQELINLIFSTIK
ncbi:MAG: hypothetical protein AUJ28_03030 [Parcubacteria group bacterium CG1_02_37_51]|uniref:Uncharacterized protein n=2 Tax=Candidatus Komeiliibacteriota TaxID=1817908 RepID=A0A2M8DRV0_9BACT|nr:MAG: hypothetical protein AUJ28_03030 [Parcubacteria group bacterium CG1_02_37_51]PIY95265.1 MAG: hypothetical protein COY67_00860 [Candidatus Komeilibacteria bacterium CG_4_10_14_0_8_um_filter_37_78]PJC02076.1 MAG: hypothetical protein CO073_01340 [Candidatus Komeilibacteria bacterium CG_4_9_14_0_8_um_filter_36_9]